MPGFNPNEARDKNGMWSKIAGLAISPEAKHQMVERLRQEEIAFAPYRSNQVDNLAQDELQRQSLEYQQYMESMKELSDKLGVKVVDKMDTLGGYVDGETGKWVQETSNIIHVEGDPERIKLLAASLGKIAPEVQDSILIAKYDPVGMGSEFEIKTGSVSNGLSAVEKLKSHGIDFYSLDKKSGKIVIFDNDNSNTQNVVNFIDDLKSSNLHEETTHNFTTGTFIQQGQYDEIIKEGGDKVRNKDGFDINNFIQKKREGYSKIALRKSRGS